MIIDAKLARNQRLRRLSGDEIELWRRVTETIERRPGSAFPELESVVAPAPPLPPKKPTVVRSPGPSAASYSPPLSQPRAQTPLMPPLERRLKQRLLRGRTPVDDVLDLHGLYQAQAHQCLLAFLLNAQAGGARLVLVITGKGRSSASQDGFDWAEGVLRRQVPHWLRAPDMRWLIIGFEEAGQPHGGAGALYVRIRKQHRG